MRELGIVLPGLLMTLSGCVTCFLSGFVGDDPQTKSGPLFMFGCLLLILTMPVGALTVSLSRRLARARGESWLWMNWIIPPVYFVLIFLTFWLSQL